MEFATRILMKQRDFAPSVSAGPAQDKQDRSPGTAQ